MAVIVRHAPIESLVLELEWFLALTRGEHGHGSIHDVGADAVTGIEGDAIAIHLVDRNVETEHGYSLLVTARQASTPSHGSPRR